MSRDSDSRRPFHHAYLTTTLKKSHFVQEMIKVDEFIWHVTALSSRMQRANPTKKTLVEFTEDSHRVINALASFQQPRKNLVDITDRESIIRAVLLD